MKTSAIRYLVPAVTVLALVAVPTAASSASAAAGPSAKHKLIAQWASSASATSQYSSTAWNAGQATHAPSVTVCADNVAAWASKSDFGLDTLTVGYKVPVIPKLVKIYESYNTGQVTSVKVVDTKGVVTEIYVAAPAPAPDCPYVLSIPVTAVTTKINKIRITVDQSILQIGWNEIDAVRLVGMT
jgi:hypothetical protein